ncbi:hypothetical protein GQ457_06G033990 [Hibiscus cannabinus]
MFEQANCLVQDLGTQVAEIMSSSSQLAALGLEESGSVNVFLENNMKNGCFENSEATQMEKSLLIEKK